MVGYIMYELEFTYRFEAAHRFTKGNSRCATPHGHTWQATLCFSAPADTLNDSDMIEEFTVLKGAWKAFITATVDHSYLHHREDPLLPVLRETVPHFRGLPFPADPTTEVIAGLFLLKARRMCRGQQLDPVAVIVQETPTNRVRFTREGLTALEERLDLASCPHAWWTVPAPDSRDI